MQRPVIGEGVSPDGTPSSPLLRARSRFSRLCDDEIVLLICPTCQVSAQSVGSGDRPATLHGVVFNIFGARATATRRDSETPCPKAHGPVRPSLQSGAPRPMKMGTIASPWRYDAAANSLTVYTVARHGAQGACANEARSRCRRGFSAARKAPPGPRACQRRRCSRTASG
jgi:hypothetical protein